MYKLRNIKQPTNAKNADIVIYTDKILYYYKYNYASLMYTVTFVGGYVYVPYAQHVTEHPIGELAPPDFIHRYVKIYGDETGSGVTFNGLPISFSPRPGNSSWVLCGAYKCINVKSFETSK